MFFILISWWSVLHQQIGQTDYLGMQSQHAITNVLLELNYITLQQRNECCP